jgi:SAM-dependent methyltransferase
MGIAVASLGGAAWLLYRGILSTPMIRATAIYCASLFGLCWFLHSELYRRRPAPQRLTTFYFFVAAGGALGAIVVGIVAPYVLPGNYELAFGFFLVAALALIATWAFGWFVRGFWVGTVVIMIALIANQVRADRINVVARDRNFYGTVWVTSLHDSSARAVVRTLYHGVITHGREIFRQDLHAIPTTYYGHNSGIGFALDLCCGNRPRRVGVIGLGTGTLATYGTPGDVFRFYDINPAVEPLARRYFTFLRESKAKVEVVDGDARVSMAREAPQQYDVIAIDAFSGDAIPVHLITSEALEVYKRQLRPNGVVVFHVSNRYLNLPPVVEQIARHAGMHTAFISSPDESIHDVWTSDWVIVTADSALIANPQVKAATDSITVPPRLRRWTDDYNSLIPILRTHR